MREAAPGPADVSMGGRSSTELVGTGTTDDSEMLDSEGDDSPDETAESS